MNVLLNEYEIFPPRLKMARPETYRPSAADPRPAQHRLLRCLCGAWRGVPMPPGRLAIANSGLAVRSGPRVQQRRVIPRSRLPRPAAREVEVKCLDRLPVQGGGGGGLQVGCRAFQVGCVRSAWCRCCRCSGGGRRACCRAVRASCRRRTLWSEVTVCIQAS